MRTRRRPWRGTLGGISRRRRSTPPEPGWRVSRQQRVLGRDGTYPGQTVDADENVRHGNDRHGWGSRDFPSEDGVVCVGYPRKHWQRFLVKQPRGERRYSLSTSGWYCPLVAMTAPVAKCRAPQMAAPESRRKRRPRRSMTGRMPPVVMTKIAYWMMEEVRAVLPDCFRR